MSLSSLLLLWTDLTSTPVKGQHTHSCSFPIIPAHSIQMLEIVFVSCSSAGNHGMLSPIGRILGFSIATSIETCVNWDPWCAIITKLSSANWRCYCAIAKSCSWDSWCAICTTVHRAGAPYKAARGLTETMTLSSSSSGSSLHIAESAQFAIQCLCRLVI